MSRLLRADAVAPIGLIGMSVAKVLLVLGYGLGYGLFIYLLRTDDLPQTCAILAASAVVAVVLRRTRYVDAVLLPLARRAARLNALVLALGVTAFPAIFLDNSYWIHVAAMCGLYVLMAQGLNVHVGDGRMINFGYAAFFAVGAYTAAILMVHGWNFWVSVPLALLGTGLVGALIGLCVLRSRGDYLALATLGLGLITVNFAINLRWLTGGPDGITGIPGVALFGYPLNAATKVAGIEIPFEVNYYYLVVVLAIAVWFALRRLRWSYLGRSWVAVGYDEVAAASLGINVPMMRFRLFIIGSLCGGLAGGLFVGLNRFVAPSDFTFLVSVTLISMVVVGGAGNMVGVTAGVVLLYLLPEKLRGVESLRLLAYGLVLIVLMIYRPAGLFPRRGGSVFRK